MQYKLMPNAMRLRVREVARQSLLDCNRDREQAITMARRRVPYDLKGRFNSILTTILISLAIRLAVELIVYWIKQNFMSPPSGQFVPGEPGA